MKLPLILEDKLAQFRRRVWIVKIAEGVLAGVVGLGISWLIVFICDRFFETPAELRGLILIVGSAGLGVGLPLKWHRWVWQQRTLENAARLLRQTFPRLGDQLLGIVELARLEAGTSGRSERLVQAAMEQAADAVRDQDFHNAVPRATHKQWAWAAAALLLAAIGVFIGARDAAWNAFARWIAPWRALERYTFARIDDLPARIVVPAAEPFDLQVRLRGDSLTLPGHADARLGDLPTMRFPLKSKAFQMTFPPRKEDAEMALSIGDVRRTIRVEPRSRPELTQLAVRVVLPEYLKYGAEQRVDIRGGKVHLLKGANARFEATCSRDLASAEWDGKPLSIKGAGFETPSFAIAGDAAHLLLWKDVEGLVPRDPLRLEVQSVEDEAPRIQARRDSQEIVVLDSELVKFDLTAKDDFGVKAAGLEWKAVPTDSAEKSDVAQGEKLAAAGAPEMRSLGTQATFCATRDGVAPGVYTIRAWAEDYLPERKRARSADFTLHVLDKTAHAIWLTEQFGKWLGAAKETYEREQQLHVTNQELRALSVAELDRPENRRRASQQGAAERANAARLSSLTDSGRRLVEQGTKNDEFDAVRLESWATMLKSLKDIAAARMPSVADLLKQTASAVTASAGTPGAVSSEAKPAQGATPPSPTGKTSAAAPTTKPGESQSQAGGPPKDAPAMPSVSDSEKSFASSEPKAGEQPAASKPGGSKAGLPTTTVAGGGGGKSETPPAPASPAQTKITSAVEEQRDLLAEFAKVSDQLNEILASLEASTFVKRFKAASRAQVKIAATVTEKLLGGFGAAAASLKTEDATPIVAKAKAESESVQLIESDLDAYFQRKQDARFKTILDEMRETRVVAALLREGEQLERNFGGRGLVSAEFWADTMDRWADEIATASNCKSCSCASSDSLPPEIVLKVMRVLRDEMDLRDRTRELESAKAAMPEESHATGADALGLWQEEIRSRTEGAAEDILALRDGASRFKKELGLLAAVDRVMIEARDILRSPETGPTVVAAETEAIELLLQAKRMGKGGGGGGSSPGGGSGAASSGLALAELGPGGEEIGTTVQRLVGQATGRAGREYPEEFKAGLDAYFSTLESRGQ